MHDVSERRCSDTTWMKFAFIGFGGGSRDHAATARRVEAFTGGRSRVSPRLADWQTATDDYRLISWTISSLVVQSNYSKVFRVVEILKEPQMTKILNSNVLLVENIVFNVSFLRIILFLSYNHRSWWLLIHKDY